MTEATITKKCVNHLKKLKMEGQPIEWLKVMGNGMQRAGEPDLSITYAGVSVKAEIKTESGRPTKLQQHRLAQWAAAGAIVGVVRSVEELDVLLADALLRGM